MPHRGAAGEEDAVEIARFDRGERSVGVHRETAATRYVDALGEGGERDLGAGAAEKIDGRCRLYFLKAFREDCENRGHGVS